jgi:hypothetical protein
MYGVQATLPRSRLWLVRLSLPETTLKDSRSQQLLSEFHPPTTSSNKRAHLDATLPSFLYIITSLYFFAAMTLETVAVAVVAVVVTARIFPEMA